MTTLFVGQNKVYLPVTDSTNSYAIDLLKNVNTSEGTVVYTDNQTKGRGQRGTVWIADSERNLTLSVILKPQFLSAKKSFYLSKISALAVYDVLAEIITTSQFDIKIKWPNDILVNSRKIAGILIENSFKEDRIQWSVAGVGLNVNQARFEHAFVATSLYMLTGHEFAREDVMNNFFSHLEKWYLSLRSEKFSLISETYFSRLFGLNESLVFESQNKQFKARIVAVSEQGLLELETENGSRKQYDIKEVRLCY